MTHGVQWTSQSKSHREGESSFARYNRCGCCLPTVIRQTKRPNLFLHQTAPCVVIMIKLALFTLAMFSLLAGTPAQRSPYAGSSDYGVLPQYLPKETDNRLGEGSTTTLPSKEMHGGTLETQDVFNRVSEWPDDRKPFWYLNANAIKKDRDQQQGGKPPQAQAVRNRPSPFISSSARRPSTGF